MNFRQTKRCLRFRAARLSAAAVLGLLSLGGCESGPGQGGPPAHVAESEFCNYSTAELRARLEIVHRRYTEISRDVELKSGLPMGVPIHDDRALLGELYREAHEIERELLRRGEAITLSEEPAR